MNKADTGILVVDDELIVRESLTKWFEDDGFHVGSAETGAAALNLLQQEQWAILLVDIKMPGMDGIELLQRVKEINADICVIIITAFGSVESAVKALKLGAFDYVTKPIDPDYLDHLVARALKEIELKAENLRLKQTVTDLSPAGEVIGDSPPMKRLMNLISTVASTDTTVMIRGESGTGKELVARAIHRNSARRYFPLVVVNCGALTETLLESELFGHERGAFTGAQYRRKGKIELADGGTLFLDEVGNVSMKTQMDLLRVIENRQFMRVGGSEMIRSDFRVVCATNRNLEEAVKSGDFREDLFYRLNVFPIDVPPLRARPGDIKLLAQYFLEHHARELGKSIRGFTNDAMRALEHHDWPGNVRELDNAVERATVVCNDYLIGLEHLPSISPSLPTGRTLHEVEKAHIERTLQEAGWNITRTASILEIDRVTLYHKMERFGIRRNNEPHPTPAAQ